MTQILLTTLNARFSHCAFGLRYLYANMGELQSKTEILEFTISQNAHDIVEKILATEARVVGFGVYIWNTRETEEVVSILKRVRPEIKIVLGGPEVSYETETQSICQTADLTIKGEADFLFYETCRNYLSVGQWPSSKWISGVLPEIRAVKLPYEYYSDSDIKNRVVYVEASRGCPYKCEYCLSSLDKSVRSFDLDQFLSAMDLLIQRGTRQFKFIDRTFNLSIPTSTRILQFFLDRMEHGLFLHFEMVPDRLPMELRDLIRKFPRGALQFEIGIQTWNPEVAKLVSRRQDYSKIRENFSFLSIDRNVHTHADLIAGLPGETLESFAAGFDAVAELSPDEIQVGLLKRLKGTPIIRHDVEWQMVYEAHQPFQILQTKTMSFDVLRRISRFSHFWDLVANSGNFVHTTEILKKLCATRTTPSLFWEFDELSTFLSARHPQIHGIALLNLIESVLEYLCGHRGVEVDVAREALRLDYTAGGRRETPRFLREEGVTVSPTPGLVRSSVPARQQRHLEQRV